MLGATLAAGAGLWPKPNGICRPAYPADNPHTENLVAFAKDVDAATSGKLQITVHPGASLFKAPDIKRAVADRTGADRRGAAFDPRERGPVFGLDVVPFLATSYPEAMKLYQASKAAIAKKLEAQGIMLLFAVPWAPQGVYVNKPLATIEDLKGLKWRSYNVGTARIGELVGAQSVTIQAAELRAGARNRRHQFIHVVGRHRL